MCKRHKGARCAWHRKARCGAIVAAAFLALGGGREAAADDVVVGRNAGDNMRWAAYRFDSATSFDLMGEEQGHGWGDSRSTTALASGDLDGDGLPEIIVGRNSGDNMRWAAYRAFVDGVVQVGPEMGHGWGDDRATSALASADIDNDGRDEVIVGRNAGGGMRWAAYRLTGVGDDADFALIDSEQGTGWSDEVGTSALAAGDVDGDGVPEIVVGRSADDNMRWAVFRYNAGTDSFDLVGSEQGHGWGDSSVSALAVGDADGDGDADVAVGRNADGNMRWAVFRFDASIGPAGDFALLGTEQGHAWGDDRITSALAMGDINGDGRAEIVVGRNGGGGMRWAVFQLTAGDFALFGSEQGTGWGDDVGTAALAAGDVDGDQLDDVIVGRSAGGNMRWAAYRITLAGTDMTLLGNEQGHGWDEDRSASEVAVVRPLPDTDGDGLPDPMEIAGIPGTTPTLTTNPLHKDILLELDAMPGQAPTRAAILALKAAFAAAPVGAGGFDNPDGAPGITLWVDTGTQADSTAPEGAAAGANTCGDSADNDGDLQIDDDDPDCLIGDNFGGGAQIATTLQVSGLTDNFYTIKQMNFSSARQRTFRYALLAAGPNNASGTSSGGNAPTTLNDTSQAWLTDEWEGRTVTITGGTGTGQTATINSNSATRLNLATVWATTPDSTSTYSISGTGGQGETGGNDFVEFNHDAGTIMHELGHGLNLSHGGDTNANCKPNYVSVMNYDLQIGIPQVGGGTIIDYSPPRTATGGRGIAPLPQLNEAGLAEPVTLDAADGSNRTVFVNSAQVKAQQNLNQPFNWNSDSDPPFEPGPVALNIDTSDTNTGRPTRCQNNSSTSILTGYDDWANIKIDFRQFADSEDGPINPVLEPEPTLEELLEQQRTINATDLELIKDGDPAVAVAGWDTITYRLIVRNLGPNPADALRVTDAFPEGLTLLQSSVPCVQEDGNALQCDLGSLPPHATTELTLVFATDAAIAEDADYRTTTIVDAAEATNELGPDPDEDNNRDTAATAIAAATTTWYALDERGVVTRDQFWDRLELNDPRPSGLLAPAAIEGEAIPDLDGTHLASFDAAALGDDPMRSRSVELINRLGRFTGRVDGASRHLLVPSAKSFDKSLEDCDCTPTLPGGQTVPHYLCYDIELRPTDQRASTARLRVSDQFLGARSVFVRLTRGLLCNPSEKNNERVAELEKAPHLMCFAASADPVGAPQGTRARISNQFGLYRRDVGAVEYLCLATEKRVRDRPRDRADLIIQSIDLDSLAMTCPTGPGSCVTHVRVTVANVGSGDADAFVVETRLDPAQSVVVPVPVPAGLAAGASATLTVITEPSGNCFDPDCTICSTADSGDDVPETDETNNKMCATKGG